VPLQLDDELLAQLPEPAVGGWLSRLPDVGR
jgi:hypothetical protein